MLGQNGVPSDSLATCPQLPVIPSQDESHEEVASPVEPVSLDDQNRQDSVSSGFTNSGSRAASFEEGPSGVRKVAVSVHDERTLLPSFSLKSTSEFIEVLQGKQDTVTRPSEGVLGGGGGGSGSVTKSTSGDNQASLGVSTSVTSVDPTAILGASTSSLTSISSSAAYRQPLARHRRFAAGCIDENDLSTPYNYYRCLSPNEHGTYSET